MYVITHPGCPEISSFSIPDAVRNCLLIAHKHGKPVIPGGLFLKLYTFLAENLDGKELLKFLRGLLRGTGYRVCMR
jgi:hypothetical protein